MKIITAEKIIRPFSVAIVTSRFNSEITEALFNGAIKRLDEWQIPKEMITAAWVPGAIEIPIAAQKLAVKGDQEVIICLGAVIRGETSHFDYVCQQVSYGCQKVALMYQIPVIFGVLTTDNEEQAKERVGGAHGHKGQDAVDAAIETVSVLRQIYGLK